MKIKGKLVIGVPFAKTAAVYVECKNRIFTRLIALGNPVISDITITPLNV